MILAIFDLDDTLTLQDTESLWQEYLVAQGFLTHKDYTVKQAEFNLAYHAGVLKFDDVVAFSIGPIQHLSFLEQTQLQHDFTASYLRKIILPQAQELVRSHYERGHHVLILSAGTEFVIEPSCSFFPFHDILCTRLMRNPCGQYQPLLDGMPLYREQKVHALRKWLSQNNFTPITSYFYSDSINDLPLLEYVDVAIAVNPCNSLREVALLKQWPILEFKETPFSQSKNTISHDRIDC